MPTGGPKGTNWPVEVLYVCGHKSTCKKDSPREADLCDGLKKADDLKDEGKRCEMDGESKERVVNQPKRQEMSKDNPTKVGTGSLGFGGQTQPVRVEGMKDDTLRVLVKAVVGGTAYDMMALIDTGHKLIW